MRWGAQFPTHSIKRGAPPSATLLITATSATTLTLTQPGAAQAQNCLVSSSTASLGPRPRHRLRPRRHLRLLAPCQTPHATRCAGHRALRAPPPPRARTQATGFATTAGLGQSTVCVQAGQTARIAEAAAPHRRRRRRLCAPPVQLRARVPVVTCPSATCPRATCPSATCPSATCPRATCPSATTTGKTAILKGVHPAHRLPVLRRPLPRRHLRLLAPCQTPHATRCAGHRALRAPPPPRARTQATGFATTAGLGQSTVCVQAGQTARIAEAAAPHRRRRRRLCAPPVQLRARVPVVTCPSATCPRATCPSATCPSATCPRATCPSATTTGKTAILKGVHPAHRLPVLRRPLPRRRRCHPVHPLSSCLRKRSDWC